jgi:hypothetical protein
MRMAAFLVVATGDWQVDAALVERITSFVRQCPGIALVAASSWPNLNAFGPLLTSGGRPQPVVTAGAHTRTSNSFDPAGLEQTRERLVETLSPRFPLPIWPWSEWSPWEVCGANLVFRVTETRGNQTSVPANDGVVDTRWDIPASLDVRLTAAKATSCETSADWTLVEYLFPIPRGRHQREFSAGILS